MGERPVALVSGGSRGIGQSIVSRLAADGYAVHFLYERDDAAAEAVTEKAQGAVAHRLDVRDVPAAKSLVAEVEAEAGEIDVVVANAGITRDSALALMNENDWRDVIDVNLTGTFALCRAAVFPMLKRQRGTVVTMSSVVGAAGNASQTNYAASKAGIMGFTRSLAKEVGRFGIRANCVAPGFIDSDMTSALPESVKADLAGKIALGWIGEPADVAEVVAFLVSERARYISGQVIAVDGGLSL